MRESDTTLSELDFERLPPALRRKYFSSLERLRLAHDGSCPIYPSRFPQEPQRPLAPSHASSRSSRRSLRRPSRTSDDSLLTCSLPTRTRLRKHSSRTSVTPQEVAHFASLPPVLQRKYFSRAEQILLASRVNHVIFDAADEVLYKHHGHRPRPTTSYKELSLDYPDLFDLDDDDNDNEEDMALSKDDLESLRWLDEEDDLDLSLVDYHAAIAETARKSYSSARAPSLRRGLLSSNVSFPRRSLSSNSIGGHAAWPLPPASPTFNTQSKSHRSAAHTGTIGHHKNRQSTSSLDPAAAHYQDPTARMKLRVYLASPQKFDEAIEFGFPSMRESSVAHGPRPKTGQRSTESNAQTCVNDDTPELSDGDDQDTEGFDSPRTPEMAAFSTAFSKSKETSLDRPSTKPKIIRDFTDPYVHGLSSNREMTLHMTLTRPDLRSPDEMSSTHEINARPLEHAPLHFSDDTATFWDSLPDSESKVRKLFRRLKLRA